MDKLVQTGLLKREPPAREEIVGLLRTGRVRLEDARKTSNAPESRFDLAYNAAHALALAALRIHGFRADKRYIVFQALAHTLAVDTPTWRLLDRCHRERNATEYEGIASVDPKLLEGLIDAALELLARVRSLAASHGLD
ncbi:MAG TPA: hypothetical protein VFP80_02350 [Thermoanaerobaculia bacterium]|nr:hypothetical protein [Thermoanaerobaculia bacterium]